MVETVARRRGLWSSDFDSWTANPSPPVRSGLIDVYRWFGVGAWGSGEGMLAGEANSYNDGRQNQQRRSAVTSMCGGVAWGQICR